VRNGGVPPTEPKARTGEFTPEGITCWAREKRSADDAADAEDAGVDAGDAEDAGVDAGDAEDAGVMGTPEQIGA
jgi:hypothetical protein